jgi:hypothetical protein
MKIRYATQELHETFIFQQRWAMQGQKHWVQQD